MLKPNARIWSIMIGSALSMASPGCSRPADFGPAAVSTPVAVVVKNTPPAELLRCAERPAGLPEDPSLIAQIPTAIRAGIIRLASAFARNADRADRLVNWTAPGSCAVGR